MVEQKSVLLGVLPVNSHLRFDLLLRHKEWLLCETEFAYSTSLTWSSPVELCVCRGPRSAVPRGGGVELLHHAAPRGPGTAAAGGPRRHLRPGPGQHLREEGFSKNTPPPPPTQISADNIGPGSEYTSQIASSSNWWVINRCSKRASVNVFLSQSV